MGATETVGAAAVAVVVAGAQTVGVGVGVTGGGRGGGGAFDGRVQAIPIVVVSVRDAGRGADAR